MDDGKLVDLNVQVLWRREDVLVERISDLRSKNEACE